MTVCPSRREFARARRSDQTTTDDDHVRRGRQDPRSHVDRAIGQAALYTVDVDDHRDTSAFGIDRLLALGAVVEDHVAHVLIGVDAPAALDLQDRTGGRVAVEERESRVLGKHSDEAAFGVANPERELVVAVHLRGAAERQLRLSLAIDIRRDDRRAVGERAVDHIGDRAIERHTGGGRRRTGRERLVELGDLPAAVEPEREHGSAEDRPGRQRRRDLHLVSLDDRI